MGKTWRWLLAVTVVLSLVAAACGSDDDDGDSAGTGTTEASSETEAPAEDEAADEEMTDEDAAEDEAADEEMTDEEAPVAVDCDTVDAITVQLQWVAQAQFAGYFAAKDEGIYDQYCLDVTIAEGAVDIVPQQQLGSGAADFAVAWVPKALVSREEGIDIVNIAQIFQRSGTLQVSFADADILRAADLEGKLVGNWGFGNELELVAGANAAGLEPGTDFEFVQQNFDMLALLNGEIDAAQAMTYNEYAQVLETVNPETDELYQPEDFNTISWEEEGVGMLQDALWADAGRLADDEAYADIATRLVAATIEGWAWCRDRAKPCVNVVLDNGTTLGRSHQAWQLNEINKLIWPSPTGAGLMDQTLWDQTVDVSLTAEFITAEPDEGAFTTEIAEAALTLLDEKGVDTVGGNWEPAEVELEEGGE
ncbi:MAG: ABC transporter substrate-binding protein [Acidimicrobiia bacterium]|nr:ABC transporter substrate-binding protein [Acidimicrobiia bacterium]